jgi:hypothetical protein
MGNAGARSVGMEKAPVTVRQSVDGMQHASSILVASAYLEIA